MRWWAVVRGRQRAGVPLADLILGGCLSVGAVIAVLVRPSATHPWSEAAVLLLVAPLVLRTRAPLVMALLSSAGVLSIALLPSATTSLWDFLALLLLAFSVGAHLSGVRAVVAAGSLVLSGWVLMVASDPDVVEQLLTPPILVGAPALAGWLLRRSRHQAEALRRLAAELAVEKERHAEAVAVAERTRIARELHDVIAHSVSVMVVQAGAAEQLLGADDAALPHVRAIRGAGRDALAELRRSLGLLRSGGGAPEAPQPTLADLPALAAASGAELTVTGSPPEDTAPGLHLTAYRVVQEALTNARRHAGNAAVRVHAQYGTADLTITVEDDGHPTVASPGGHGLVGMGERAALYGGNLQAGPREDAPGWRVTLHLPLPAVREALAR